MTTVTITRRTQRYRRSVNGAWLAGHCEAETLVRDEEILRTRDVQYPLGVVRSRFSVGDGIEVEWPDGVKESCYSHGTSHSGKPYLAFIPADGRLSRLITD